MNSFTASLLEPRAEGQCEAGDRTSPQPSPPQECTNTPGKRRTRAGLLGLSWTPRPNALPGCVPRATAKLPPSAA